MQHITSIHQFKDLSLHEQIFKRAQEFKSAEPNSFHSLDKKIVATLFYEPSTRTRLSFETAVYRLSGQVISTENAGQFSSAAKGETLEDSIQTINNYADAIVLRHPSLGAAEAAAKVSDVPIINAGDGAGEHPTQALLDLYTIWEAKQHNLTGLKVALVGDLLNGRTIHSLIHVLAMYKPTLYLVAPPQLQLQQAHQDELAAAGIDFKLLDSWDDILGEIDVLYQTRVQKERFGSIDDYEAVKDSFIFDKHALAKLSKEAIIMHPLPRVNEITTDVDNDPRAIYFHEAGNGLYVRMALLEYILTS